MTITKEYAWELFLAQAGLCALSGVAIYLPGINKERCTASIDRIDSNMGYVPGNVQWVHKDINIMKNILPQGRFIELCRAVAVNKT